MNKKYVRVIVSIFVIISIISYVMGVGPKNSREVVYQGNRYMVSVDGGKVSRFPSGDYYLVDYDCNNKHTIVSWNRETSEVSVSNGNHKGGVSCYLSFESRPKLSSMKAGSYVQYVGNNGCNGNACSGVNANYSDNLHQGYCHSKDMQYYLKGYRIAYTKENTAYLVSAGAPECMCTSSDGGTNQSCATALSVTSIQEHIQNLNQVALKYCNSQFAYGGVCDNQSAWNINDNDFRYMIGNKSTIVSCLELQNGKCGYSNDLINIGGDYWYSFIHDNGQNIFYWDSIHSFIGQSASSSSFGVRPVIRMSDSVVVTGGDGTANNPYQISNYTFAIGKQDNEKGTLQLSMLGYQVKEMCININSAVCTNYVPFASDYTLDIGNAFEGENVIYVYYKDVNGEVITAVNRKFSL